MYVCRFILFVISIGALTIHGENDTASDNAIALYTDIKPANRTESLNRIRNVEFVNYKYKYDSVVDRSQMGVIGLEAQKWFPESIDVVPSYTFASKDKSKPSTELKNFPIIDKNVIFMHGVAAIQQLLVEYEASNSIVAMLERSEQSLKATLTKFEQELELTIDAKVRSELLIASLRMEEAERLAVLEETIADEDRKLTVRRLQEERSVLEYEQELARSRLTDQSKLARENMILSLGMEKELAQERERMQRETAEALLQKKLDQEKDLKDRTLEFEKEKIRTELEVKAKIERDNEETIIRQLEAKSKAETERILVGIQQMSTQLSAVAVKLFSEPKYLLMFLGAVLFFIAFYFTVRELAALLRSMVQARLGKPMLVRETSTASWLSFPRVFAESTVATMREIEKAFNGVILRADDKSRVISLAIATRNTRSTKAPYRHVLFHGPPGTGKTLIARRLAECSGMDYAIMSGGDVAPLGEDAVNQLHNIFKWAGRSSKGLLIFIDEAEAFLSSRGVAGAGSAQEIHCRNALNALLFQTGSPTRQFMLVLATNRPEDLDPAVLDRVDVTLNIDLPDLNQRTELVNYYFKQHVLTVADEMQRQSERNFIQRLLFGQRNDDPYVSEDCNNNGNMEKIATKLDGFSGREISKLFLAVQIAMLYAPPSSQLATENGKQKDQKKKEAGKSKDSKGKKAHVHAPGPRPGRLSMELLWDTVISKHSDHRVKLHGFNARAGSSSGPPSPKR